MRGPRATPGTGEAGAAGPGSAARVSVVVIGHNDVRLFPEAVASALAQGPSVAEVVAVDDASTDGTADRLTELARGEPRLRVLRRALNSGGCGTPRNDGLRAATAPWVMFLDSDDLLAPGAVPLLLAAAERHRVPVVAGGCLRREVPAGREVPWQPDLFRSEAVYQAPDLLPDLVRDTLCVNKLYDRAFLLRQRITFPEGPRRYEDFVFTARLLAAVDRLAVVPAAVYLWHVRRSARTPSISLARGEIGNWRDRLAAHREAVRILERAGAPRLAHAARVKFLDHDLRLYVRELPHRDPDYVSAWWRLTRDHLCFLTARDSTVLRRATLPAHWLADLVRHAPADHQPPPRELDRMAQLAARSPRLLPPYARGADSRPVWSADLPQVPLEAADRVPAHLLPVAVDACSGTGDRGLRLWVHDPYGRLAAAGAHTVDLELWHRDSGRPGPRGTATLLPEADGWRAEPRWDLEEVAAHGDDRVVVWDLWARLHCRTGPPVVTAVRAGAPRARRGAVPSRRHGLLLVQPYATADGSLALRVAPGARGLLAVTANRARRLPPVPGRLTGLVTGRLSGRRARALPGRAAGGGTGRTTGGRAG